MIPNLSTLEGLEAALREEPNNWNLRRVYADLLEESGRSVEANGQRWQARECKVARYSGGTSTWDWWTNHTYIPYLNLLPHPIWQELRGHIHADTLPYYYKEYRSVGKAELELALALQRLGIRVRGDE